MPGFVNKPDPLPPHPNSDRQAPATNLAATDATGGVADIQPSTVFTNDASTTAVTDVQPSTVFTNDASTAAVAGTQPSTVFTNDASTTAAADVQPSGVFTNDASTAAMAGIQPSTVFTNDASTTARDGPSSNLSAARPSQSVTDDSLDLKVFTSATSTPRVRPLDSKATSLAGGPDTSPLTGLISQSQTDIGPKKKRRKLYLILGGIIALVIVATAVAVPVAITKTRKSSSTSFAGGDGSTITTEKGTIFTYVNKFGGTWYDDPSDPFNNNAQAQSWSPPLSEEWDYQKHPMRGVNLGGWLVPEPLVVPSLFEPYVNASPPVRDEWTLSIAMAADTARGGLSQLEQHYDTFITEEDFAQIAAAGLNWVRLPLPYWAVEKYPVEPFLPKVSWQYALKAFKWARKYGLRVYLELHTIPGSQNGSNHSGKGGQINFLYGPMGLANAQRTLDYIRIITEFISQPEYAPVVPMFGIMNEPLATTIGMDQMNSFYLEVHDMIRAITGTGKGKGPFIAIHDSFLGLAPWKDLLPGHDRLALDTQKYLLGTIDRTPLTNQIDKPCQLWAAEMNSSWTNFGVSMVGGFSLAVNDCGLWVNGLRMGTLWEGTIGGGDGVKGDCAEWTDWERWGQVTKDNFKAFAFRNFDAFGHWFFYTWKIGASSVTGKIESPMWSYQLGWQQGWIPADPSQAAGACENISPAQPLTPEMVGAAGPGTISASVRAQYPWPPTQLNPNNLDTNNIPVYTPTGTIPILPVPTSPIVGGVDGWYNDGDTRPMYTPIVDCNYPDAWGSAEANNTGRC